MAELARLEFVVRENVKKSENKRWMRNGYLIANINGKGMASIPIVIKKDEFRKVLKEYGKNCVLKLKGNSQEYDVMVKLIQTDPKNYEYHHVDFQRVLLTERIKAEVSIKYLGVEFLEAKRLVLNRLVDAIAVSGLPQDIPDMIEYDVSKLKAGDNIYIKDLTLSKELKLEMDDDQLIGSIIESKLMDIEVSSEEEV